MPSDQFPQAAEYVVSPNQIATFLGRLRKEYPLLIVSFPGDDKLYSSALLSIDRAKGRLTLDELRPMTGHQHVRAGGGLRIHGRLAGVDVHFTVTVLEVAIEQGIHLYHAALPESLLYRQRREFVRVPLGLGLSERASLTAPTKTAVVRLLDISAGGIGGVILQGGPLATGEHYHCSFELGPETVSARVEVRFIAEQPGEPPRFGALFRDLSPRSRRHIARTLMQLQRELIRT
jgi:c-di-GMP-binding flagellar brake protein YcgR